MINKETIDKISKTILEKLPGNLSLVKNDLEQCVKSCVKNALGEFDLVSKEEFDSQAKTLANAQSKLKELSEKITELEKKLTS
jgi:BMFP domain-containing protein YqiC